MAFENASVKCFGVGQFFRFLGQKSWLGDNSESILSRWFPFGAGETVTCSGLLAVHGVGVMQNGRLVCAIPFLSTLSSKHASWKGIVLKSFSDGRNMIDLLAVGTRDQLTRSGPVTCVNLVRDPGFLARSIEETAHLDDVDG
jgi:hypothetical protein